MQVRTTEQSQLVGPKATIFVIMPFVKTPSRDKASLDHFFQINLKEAIESNTTLKRNYTVFRSADSFDITAKIISDLYESDIVICDLSGEHANPNVMYELGVRLAISNAPVILIRESNPNNSQSHTPKKEYNLAFLRLSHSICHLPDDESSFMPVKRGENS